MGDQFDARRDARGWTVFDRFTGRTVVLSRAQQSGMDWAAANELVSLLNLRRQRGDRRILQ